MIAIVEDVLGMVVAGLPNPRLEPAAPALSRERRGSIAFRWASNAPQFRTSKLEDLQCLRS